MLKNQKFLGILTTVVVVLVLIAGGFGLYRLGFMHGAAANINFEDLQLSRETFMPFHSNEFYAMRAFPHSRGFISPMGFNPLGGFIGLLFFGFILFLIFRGIASMFWDRRMHMAYGHPWGAPPWASEARPAQTAPETQETDN